jgi:hypothetical protein
MFTKTTVKSSNLASNILLNFNRTRVSCILTDQIVPFMGPYIASSCLFHECFLSFVIIIYFRVICIQTFVTGRIMMKKRYENCLIWILKPGAAGEMILISNAPFRETHLWPLVCMYCPPTRTVNS